ncbi:MAG: SGNH hydrolase domain-containing protein [Thiolinea sp.]
MMKIQPLSIIQYRDIRQFNLLSWYGLLFLLVIIAANMRIAYAADAEVRAHILQVSDPVKSGEYVRKRFVSQQDKAFGADDQRKKMLIMGDSHAQDFYNALSENNINQRYQVRTRRIPAICGVYLGPEDISGLIEKKHIPICDKAGTLAAAMPQIQQADVVIIAANWKLWSAQRLKTTVKNLQIKSSQKLFVVGRKNFGKLNLRQYLRMPTAELRQLRNPVHGAQQEINRIMKQTLSPGVFVDIQGLICRNEADCPLFTPQTRLISFDGGHLTPDGAKFVGGVVLQHAPLNEL